MFRTLSCVFTPAALCCRDGEHWQRSYRSSTGAPAWGGHPSSPNDTAWDARWHMAPNGPIHVQNSSEVRYYYNGFNKGGFQADHIAAVGFYTYPQRDRYVSISDGGTWGSSGGQITLRPVFINGTVLTVNARPSGNASGARLSVELLDENGWRVPGFGREHCSNVSGDGSELAVSWTGADGGTGGVRDTSALPPGEYKLRIYLLRMMLFAVDFHRSEDRLKSDDGAATPQPQHVPQFLSMFNPDFNAAAQHSFANLAMSPNLTALVDAHEAYGMRGFLSIEHVGVWVSTRLGHHNQNMTGLEADWRPKLQRTLKQAEPHLKSGALLGMCVHKPHCWF